VNRRSNGVTLVELVVACSLGLCILLVFHEACSHLSQGERSIDKESANAIKEAEMMEKLLQDVRSSASIESLGSGEYRIMRYVMGSKGAKEAEVVWKLNKGSRVTRHIQGKLDWEYKFPAGANSRDVQFRLNLEAVRDVGNAL